MKSATQGGHNKENLTTRT